MEWQTLVVEQVGPVLRVTANRPHVLNAQSRLMIRDLDEALRLAGEDADVRVVVVAGAGKHFSAGHDIGSPEELEDQKRHPVGPGVPENAERLAALYLETCLRWRDLPKPTIAQVQGYCIMGGLMLASCCDLIVASEDALFADRSVRWGGPHVQYFTMPWELGPRKAKEYLFTGDYLSAREALGLGLVNRVVPRADLEGETMRLAERIALQDPFALRVAKTSVNQMMDIQGHRVSLQSAFQHYLVTVPHRQALGTFGPEAWGKGVREQIERRDRRFGERPQK